MISRARRSSNNLMTVASADINLQRKHNLICQVAKVKAAASAHSVADVIHFLVYLQPCQAKRTPQEYINELLIRNLNLNNAFILLLIWLLIPAA